MCWFFLFLQQYIFKLRHQYHVLFLVNYIFIYESPFPTKTWIVSVTQRKHFLSFIKHCLSAQTNFCSSPYGPMSITQQHLLRNMLQSCLHIFPLFLEINLSTSGKCIQHLQNHCYAQNKHLKMSYYKQATGRYFIQYPDQYNRNGDSTEYKLPMICKYRI